jgi:hypothetical protein
VQCRQTDLPSLEASHQITLHGTGLLLDSSSCYIHSEVFKLLPHSFGKSEITLNRTRIELPNIYNIFNSSDQELLLPESKEPDALRLLDAVIERAASRSATSGVDVKHIIKTLRDEQQQYLPSTLLWVIGILITLIFILILIILGTRPQKLPFLELCNCVRVARHSHPTPDAMELKCKPLDLQTLARVNNEEQPATTGHEKGDPTSHGSPTRFVRHGVLNENV